MQKLLLQTIPVPRVCLQHGEISKTAPNLMPGGSCGGCPLQNLKKELVENCPGDPAHRSCQEIQDFLLETLVEALSETSCAEPLSKGDPLSPGAFRRPLIEEHVQDLLETLCGHFRTFSLLLTLCFFLMCCLPFPVCPENSEPLICTLPLLLSSLGFCIGNLFHIWPKDTHTRTRHIDRGTWVCMYPLDSSQS